MGSDGSGSGFSYLWIELQSIDTDESVDLELDSDDLTSQSEFSIKEDFQWKAGSYRPVSASIGDSLGNSAYLEGSGYGHQEELTSEQIQDFKDQTGIDLSSNPM